MKVLIFLFCFWSAYGQVAHYEKVLLSDASAVCLDGSPGAYYISKGQNPEKVILYFEGGGWCGAGDLSATVESCYQRSSTGLGSSSSYPDTLDVGEGFLSNNAHNDFRNYTKVFLKYCDGAGHQGSREAPLSYKGKSLYFRGNNITLAQFNSLEQKIGLFSIAQEIIVSGGSAGGLAAFLWADFVSNKSEASKVYAVPDSGIFLDSQNMRTKTNLYRQQFQNLFKLSNTESGPPTPECLQEFSLESHRCMFAQNLAKYIKTPIFAVQSLYDSWSIPNILGIRCINGNSLDKCSDDQMLVIEQYHRNGTVALFQIANNPQNGFWAPVCVNHVYVQSNLFYSLNYRIPQQTENSITFALKSWIDGQGETNKHYDSGSWPENKPCSGIKRRINLRNKNNTKFIRAITA